MNIKLIKFGNDDFYKSLKYSLALNEHDNSEIQAVVNSIIKDIKKNGDSALLSYTKKFDHLESKSLSELELTKESLKQAYDSLDSSTQNALNESAQRIRDYHQNQIQNSWDYVEEDGTRLGQKITAIDSVGLYVPGGKASYPSSVLMNAIPAKVAGVKNIIMVVPTPNGERNSLVLAAAHVVNVDRVFTIGGAQAVAALAFGTETIPQVDKIVGPGNAYVAEAKRIVFGTVGIDMIAGPSEILIITDGHTNPDWLAMDLFSQAEHDELAQSILISSDNSVFEKVIKSMEKLIDTMPRKKIIQTSLENRGLFIQVDNLNEAAEVSNFISPEHLELSVSEPDDLIKKIKHAGAIFMGINTCESVGDYCAGPNHVLPTSRTARFSSPLGVYDFQKRSSIINLSSKAASRLGKIASVMAEGEGLFAHARSADYRVKIDD
ncbi:MAG: histidinol dehydrogenase [Proteobacteria bacterium]|nr:histidinol dehydrogenase [Pseudomonadota bacterium]MDA0941469.1 histidinol dehydrogenase [Pseudomonadota bacterium]MDA1034413.1 histidinol dehydrogenase [Pseudomonadota bacterium]